jgi:hypothetical protein
MVRELCDQILKIIPIFRNAIKAPLEEINSEILNKQLAKHKMSIGQLAIHCTAWMTYFLSDQKPWKVEPWTCKPVRYPLSLTDVLQTIDEGFKTMTSLLQKINDKELEIRNNEKGPGYIILRLLHHINAHSNQMSYLRQLEDKEWDFGSHFGDIVTALIVIPYYTTRDMKIGGF